MVLHRWLDAFYRRTTRKHHQRQKVGRAELFEQRTLLTVSASFDELIGILQATAGADGDVIIVSHNGDLVFINGSAIPDPETGELSRLSNVDGIGLFGSATEQHATDFRIESDFGGRIIAISPGLGNDTVVGGPGREVIVDNGGDNDLRGNGGNDTISVSGFGNNILVGGAGDDSILGGFGNDQIFGDAGEDTLNGSNGNDSLQGGDDDDELDGGDGNDSLFGQGGNDSIVGGTGNDGFGFEGAAQGQDTLDESPGEANGEDFIEFSFFSTGVMLSIDTPALQTVSPGNLTLSLTTAPAFEIIIGSPFADTLFGNAGDNFLFGGAGNDLVVGGPGEDFLFGQAGNDTLEGNADADTLNAGEGNDSVSGGDGDDSLSGQAGDDALEGGDGADTVKGGEGSDTLDGGLGDDRLDGEGGGDQLDGREGSNTLRGGVDFDDDQFIVTTSGDVRLESSGSGVDTLDCSQLSQGVVIKFTKIDETQTFLADGSQLFLEFSVDAFIGTNFNDVFIGRSSPDVVTTIFGGGQNGQPGDSLFVQLLGVDNPVVPPGNSASGTIFYDNGAPITFNGMERFGVFNADPAPAVSGTTASETATIAFGPGAEIVEVQIGDDVALLRETDSLESLNVNLGDNDDKLTVNLSDNRLPLEINYDGGLGADLLEVTGTGVSSVNVELLDASSGTLEIVPFDPNGAPAPEGLIEINYTGLEPVDLTELPTGEIQFVLPVTDDTAVLESTGTPGEFVLRSTNGTFEETSFVMPESLTILDNGGNDTLTIDAQDRLVVRDGDQITIGDDPPITVQGIETVNFINAIEIPPTGVSVVGTTLLVAGDDRNDRITITESGQGINVTIGGERLQVPAEGLTQLKVFGLEGNDQISVSVTSPLEILIDAGSDNDRVSVFGNHAATIVGGSGTDHLRGGNGPNLLRGGAGNDTLVGGQADDHLDGEAGRDSLTGNAGDDTLSGGDDNDRLDGGVGDDEVFGGAGNDHVLGRSGHDTLAGDDGQDTLLGDSGNDEIHGNAGNDQLDGNSGDDSLLGGDGNDKVNGHGGNDRLNGDADNDTLVGGSDNDTLIGGDGNDSLQADAGHDGLNGGAGNDTLRGGSGHDSLLGGDGNDSLRGEAGNDTLLGGDGRDQLKGESGLDTLAGGPGTDSLQDTTAVIDESFTFPVEILIALEAT